MRVVRFVVYRDDGSIGFFSKLQGVTDKEIERQKLSGYCVCFFINLRRPSFLSCELSQGREGECGGAIWRCCVFLLG